MALRNFGVNLVIQGCVMQQLALKFIECQKLWLGNHLLHKIEVFWWKFIQEECDLVILKFQGASCGKFTN